MSLSFEYLWFDSFLNSNYTTWLDGSISWEEVFSLTLNEVTLVNSIFSAVFPTVKVFLDSFTKLSFLDTILLFDLNSFSDSNELFFLFCSEFLFYLNIKYVFAQFLFYTDYQDYFLILLYYSPELILSLTEFFTTFFDNGVFNYQPSTWTDLFNDQLSLNVSEFTEYLILLVYYFWFIVFFVNVFRLNSFNSFNDFFFVRFLYYFRGLIFELRFHFDGMLQVVFFAFFYWTMMVAAFDDDEEEFIEMFTVGFFYFFLFVMAFFIFKYSKHYFSFLEMSVVEGKSVSFITKQFVRDMTNTFALFLRFFLLLFRANIYDGLDDVLDSYYIFLGDFDEDEYLDFSFFSIFSLTFFDGDAQDDSNYLLEEENEFFFDIFSVYYLVWGKFFFFLFFILEEIFRILLAFYIVYLIIFDVHAVNCSYLEDTFFLNKRLSTSRNLSNL